MPRPRSRRGAGPPPRVWGYRAPRTSRGPASRSTPTRVGIPRCPCRDHAGAQVHPHACGDTLSCGCASMSVPGPPPRVWGYQWVVGDPQQHDGSTPTRVGIPPSRVGRARPPPVHPHACGDTLRLSGEVRGHAGPPPRVWGYPRHRRSRGGRCGSTPTRVGIPPTPKLLHWATRVHPHACGDTPEVRMTGTGSVGPPPRVWGYPEWAQTNLPRLRSTPTRVGIPLASWNQPVVGAVHPHACGDTVVVIVCGK